MSSQGLFSMSEFDFAPQNRVVDERGVRDFWYPITEASVDRVFVGFSKAANKIVGAENFENSPTAEALWLTLIYAALDTANCFQNVALATRSRAAGYRAVHGGHQSLLAKISDGQKFSSPFVQRYRNLTRPRSNMMTWARFIKSAIKGDSYSRKPPALIDQTTDILCFSGERWHAELARAEGGRLVVSDPENWFSPLSDDSLAAFLLDDMLVEAFVDAAEQVFHAEGVEMPPHVRASLRTGYEDLARIALAMSKALEDRHHYLPKRFWSISATGIHARIMGNFLRKQGGEVTVFDHGTGCGWMASPELALMEFAFCNRFITFSEAHAVGIRHLIQQGQHYLQMGPPCRVISSPIPLYDCSVTSSRKKRLSDGPLQIWYLPSHYTLERLYLPPLAPDIVQLDFQAHLIGALASFDCEITVKPHPGCKIGFSPQLKGLAKANLETRAFEEVIMKPDVVIMDYPQSTTFRSIMLADVPLVILDPRRVPFKSEAQHLLRSRAERIKITYDEKNRRRVNVDALGTAITDAPKRTSSAFREAYYPSA